MEDFSVCVIARNEERGLGRLLKSLAGVKDIVVLDTGSTDRTVEIAKSYGCNIVSVGDRFRYKATQAQVDEWQARFGWKPAFDTQGSYFHFADARNYCASFAKNDWVFCPDGDEEMRWDLAKVREVIQHEDHLVYRFAYAHNPDGTPALEFTQCKFFRRSKFHWTKWVHEVEGPLPGQNPKPPFYCDFIYHHHWQNPTTARANYLPGLELSVLGNFDDDRNVFYLGREYMWLGRWDEAIFMFKHALEIQTWLAERGEAWHFIGNCYRTQGKNSEAIEAYHHSMMEDDSRREAFFALASLYDDAQQLERAIVYYQAAMAIPYSPHGYLNDMKLFGATIPDRLAFAHHRLGHYEESKKWWLEAMAHNPDERILSNFRFYYGYSPPLVSIVVPTVRPDGFRRLEESIKRNTLYPNWEIVKVDGEGTAIEKFNKGVEQAKGDFIVFLADDTEVCYGWLVQAYTCFKEHFDNRGLVVLNEGYWRGAMANHFFCSKNIRDELDGEIWHGGYHHVGADNELSQRLKQKRLIAYAPNAKIIHHHPWTQTDGTPPAPNDEYYERIYKHLEADRQLLCDRQRALKFGPKIAAFCTTNNNADIIEEFVRESLKYVAEVYISDNGSTDGTAEIARADGARVRDSGLVHNDEDYNEGATKQKALDFAMASDCDWFLYLDSDEILEERAATILPHLINDLRYDSYGMAVPTFWLDRVHYRVDGDFAMYINHPYPTKLFNRQSGIQMTDPPKGQHSRPQVKNALRHTDCDLMVKHYSFPDRETALRKYNRYRKADPDSVMSRSVPHYEHIHPDYSGVKLESWGQFYPALNEIVRQDDLVFDIGANAGNWTRIFKSLGARVVSVEPNPEAADSITNDVVVRKACTDRANGTLSLCLPNDHDLSVLATILPERAHCNFYHAAFDQNKTIQVPTTTLDELIEQYGVPKHIKVDVEGAEVQVLKGLSCPVQWLSFEILGMQPDWNEPFDLIEKLGEYQFNITSGLDSGPEDWKFLTEWGSKESIEKYFQSIAKPTSYFNVYCRRAT